MERSEMRAVAADKDGNRSQVPVVPIDLSSNRAPKPGGFVKYETRLIIKGTASHVFSSSQSSHSSEAS